MTKPIGPGSMLVCIKKPDYNVPAADLTIGALYTCEEVLQAKQICPTDGCGHEGIRLKERGPMWVDVSILGLTSLQVEIPYPIYCPNIFRPLDDGDTSLVKDEDVEHGVDTPDLVGA